MATYYRGPDIEPSHVGYHFTSVDRRGSSYPPEPNPKPQPSHPTRPARPATPADDWDDWFKDDFMSRDGKKHDCGAWLDSEEAIRPATPATPAHPSHPPHPPHPPHFAHPPHTPYSQDQFLYQNNLPR